MFLSKRIRFNVYSQIYYGKQGTYYLEATKDALNWESVTHSGNILNYNSQDLVAKRIVELAPFENAYTRVIFSDKPLDKSEGKLEGIDLGDGKPYLIDSLTRDEKVNLLGKIQSYFDERKMILLKNIAEQVNELR